MSSRSEINSGALSMILPPDANLRRSHRPFAPNMGAPVCGPKLHSAHETMVFRLDPPRVRKWPRTNRPEPRAAGLMRQFCLGLRKPASRRTDPFLQKGVDSRRRMLPQVRVGGASYLLGPSDGAGGPARRRPGDGGLRGRVAAARRSIAVTSRDRQGAPAALTIP
jgi:hypothetical protein